MKDYTIWDSFKLPEDISTYGKYSDWLFNYITLWNFFYFLLVCIGLFGFSWYYRASKKPKVDYTHGYRKKQLLVTFIIGAAVFFTVDAFIASKSSYDLKKYFWNFPTENVFRVEVLASQWMWTFRYPGPDDEFNTDDDVLTNHELYIPVNRKIELRLTSRDVIHSFYLPNIRNKVDAMPGRISRIWFETTKTGTYDIACAEMCGTHHYKMKGSLFVMGTDEFQSWINEAQKIAQFSVDPENRDNYWGWPWENKK